ncbi:MAG: M23 family metallopeptidase [Myxococcaceae bacterium]|nr:M23 family metallopeptidase [Myxococcaceae bacterium]
MGLLDAASTLQHATDPRREAARELESLVMKQLLAASGAFKGGEAAGSGVWADLMNEAVASSVTRSGQGLGLASMLEQSLPATQPAEVIGLVAGAGTVSSGFGARVDPIDGSRSFHYGVDVAAGEGTPILAAAAGVVVQAGPRGGYGNAVEVAHPDGTTTLYAHASDLSVGVGQRVEAGQILGAVGHTGRSTGDHLHFEVRSHGQPIDPRRALQKYGARVDETDGENPPKGGGP